MEKLLLISQETIYESDMCYNKKFIFSMSKFIKIFIAGFKANHMRIASMVLKFLNLQNINFMILYL